MLVDVCKQRQAKLSYCWLNCSKEIVGFHLGNHGCLDLDPISTQMIGGPTTADGASECEYLMLEHRFLC